MKVSLGKLGEKKLLKGLLGQRNENSKKCLINNDMKPIHLRFEAIYFVYLELTLQ